MWRRRFGLFAFFLVLVVRRQYGRIGDVRVGVESDSIELALYATNVTDYEYILFSSETVRRFNQPRLFGAQVRYKW